jgi:hypothetical protein
MDSTEEVFFKPGFELIVPTKQKFESFAHDIILGSPHQFSFGACGFIEFPSLTYAGAVMESAF